MFTIQDAPIHWMGDRCVYPSKKLMNKKTTQCSYEQNRQELYGNTEQQFSRFNELGVPMFVVKIENSSDDLSNDLSNESPIHTQGSSSVISNELFDQLFERVSKPKKVKKNKKNKSGDTKSKRKARKTRKSKKK